MPALLSNVDPDGLLEYSVVYTDRALNHMSAKFQGVMKDISGALKTVYRADAVAIVPGSGTFAMEAVARQIAANKKCLVLRNGWFSYRWSQILDRGAIASDVRVLKAAPTSSADQAPFAPAAIETVVETIQQKKPDIVFAPHVETSAGIIMPDAYLKAVADAAHSVGALFVLDCIASGAIWVDMRETGVDVLISAPQKGWSASPCCGLVMMNETARDRVKNTQSDSFACDLKQWLEIMEKYESGAHAYHATMPTDGLTVFRDTLFEIERFGFKNAKESQQELGARVRSLLADKGFSSVAAAGFEAPGVVVSYTDDARVQNGSAFAEAGLQIAAGVPLQCDESASFTTFRIGLFGLDKLADIERTVASLAAALERV
ncbi:MAG: aminotransferase class V-fold PLP-dependent enzyme [Pseudomonadota bacterium]